jgi:hypothetical protein
VTHRPLSAVEIAHVETSVKNKWMESTDNANL